MTATLHDRGLVWLRRDLRTQDHTALHQALAECRQVYCAFVFDRDILEALAQGDAARAVKAMHGHLSLIETRLRPRTGGDTAREADVEAEIAQAWEQARAIEAT